MTPQGAPSELETHGHIVSHSGNPQLQLQVSSLRRLGVFPASGGAYSDVYKATLTQDDRVITVAVKVLRRNERTQAVVCGQFNREVACWKILIHENIAPLYGVCSKWVGGQPAFVLPWYENGTANNYIANHPNAHAIPIIKGIADGLAYMHEKGMVHGDIKGANVMIDNKGNARLIDFGLSRSIHMSVDEDPDSDFSEGFSIRWCAPELLLPGAASMPSSDIYAFASTVLELLSRRVPYHKLSESVVLGKVMRGVPPLITYSDLSDLHLPNSQDEQEDMLSLLRSCWEEAALRPKMSDVLGRLMKFPS